MLLDNECNPQCIYDYWEFDKARYHPQQYFFVKSLPSRSSEDENSYHTGDGDPVLQKDLSVDLKAIRGK